MCGFPLCQILNRYLYVVGGGRTCIQSGQCHFALIVDPRCEQSDDHRPADQERERSEEVDITEEAAVLRQAAKFERNEIKADIRTIFIYLLLNKELLKMT